MQPLEIQWGGKSTDLIDPRGWIHSFSCYINQHTRAYNIDAEIVHRSIEDYVDVELEKLAVCLALPGQIKKKANSALEMLLNHDEHKVSEKNLVALFKKQNKLLCSLYIIDQFLNISQLLFSLIYIYIYMKMLKEYWNMIIYHYYT